MLYAKYLHCVCSVFELVDFVNIVVSTHTALGFMGTQTRVELVEKMLILKLIYT